MHFKFMSLAIATICATAVQGWKIPKGTPDGFYGVNPNPDGTFTHTRLPYMGKRAASPVNSAKFGARSQLEERQSSVTCAGYGFPNHSDLDSSFHNLQHQCDYYGPVGGHLDYYSIIGDSVTYFCNFNGGSVDCSSGGAYNALVGEVTDVCGSYESGWTNSDSVSYGYELVSHDAQFCGQSH